MKPNFHWAIKALDCDDRAKYRPCIIKLKDILETSCGFFFGWE